GYNPTYLGRVFREEQAQGFREWLNAYRLDKAAALLRSTDTPVHRIAAAVGYLQYKRFLAHFKECYAVTPKQYRIQPLTLPTLRPTTK
ncbi:MAG: helix-turn-helix transcriptional regulator, partial [Clostridia bacterium]